MNLGPWTFYQYRYGFSHVICDAEGRIIASSVNELLDIVDEELATLTNSHAVADAAMVAKAMRERLAEIEMSLRVRFH